MPQNPLSLHEFQPEACLVTPERPVQQPRFPAIDAHNHLGAAFGDGWDSRPLSELLETMDAAGIEALVDLDGGWGEDILYRHLEHFKARAPERFAHFGGVDWDRWAEHGDRFGEWAAAQLERQVQAGAQGLKIWKNLGLHVRDQHNALVAIDDARLAPLWETAGALGIPVTIHIADPVAFFRPLDTHNERWEELHAHPDWHFPAPAFPAFEMLIEALARLILRHPRTTFIGAHMGCYAENLAWVGALLDATPNFHIDISARIAELGRQPYTARRFFLRYADRILFGTDAGVHPATYRLHYRFLETEDEYFNYAVGAIPPQGRWRIYGLYLPDAVLEQIYRENARRLLHFAEHAAGSDPIS